MRRNVEHSWGGGAGVSFQAAPVQRLRRLGSLQQSLGEVLGSRRPEESFRKMGGACGNES